MKEADDIRVAIPIEVNVGPSFDLGFKNKNVILEFDILKLNTQLLVNWPGNSESQVEVSFVEEFDFDFYLSLRLFGFLHFSISETPIIGNIIKCIASIVISKQIFKLNIPKAQVENNEANAN